MAKAPGESRIPTFGSRIPIPGKFRFLPNLKLRTPSTNLTQDTNKTCTIDKTPEIDRTVTLSPANSDPNCTVTLDANLAGATFVMKCIKSPSPAPTQLNKTLVLNEGQVEQDLVTNVNPVPALSVKNNRSSLISGNIISNDKNNVDMNTTCNTILSDNSFNCGGSSTPITERRKELKTKNHDSSSESTCSPNKLNVTVVKALDLNKTVNITPAHSPNDIPTLTKQNSFEFDESLGILTPDQMVDFSSFMRNTGSASSDDLKSILAKHNERITSTSRTPSSENLGSVSKDGFKIPLTSVPMSSKNSAIQDQKFSFDTVKVPSSEDLKSLIYSNQNVLTRTEILNSVDESLGILTSDQMVEFSTYVHNTGTVFSDDLKLILAKHNERLSLSSRKLPSSDDLKSLISNPNTTRRIERQNTFSRTPSSENLCSEVKFSTNSFTCDSSKMCDESSLMILTPEQMEISVFDASKTPSSENLKSILCSHRSDKTISNSRTPSSENVGSLPHDAFKQPLPVEPLEIQEESLSLSRPCSIDLKSSSDPIKPLKISASHQADISSPNAVENSMIDFSLGLLEEDMLATGNQFSSMIDTTTNLELPLDSISGDKIERFKSLSRSDQTPSPEDLPLDPIDPIKPVEMDIIEPNLLHPSTDSDPKTDVSKSTTTKTNSFITSVTSITSLDTGYQGDGEMSRPASRGADHSPMAHKPNNPALVNLQWQRAIARRQDPMTDSDFFTESDADIHEDNAPRGDRRAQVIDGNLYGPNAQAPAAQDIFIGNQEEMDSSGIFTDLDMNRPDDFSDGERNRIEVIIVTEDKSPSEISTKSITENSQELKEPEDLESTLVNETQDTSIMEVTESISEKPKSPTQSINSNSSRKNARARTDQSKDENPSKKFKMPKRNVTSKVKTMMEQKQDIENQENRKPKPTRKPTAGRWDAVMNKISQGKDENKSKIRLKEVKSKVSTGISGTPTTKRDIQKTDTNTFTKPKIRRVRARGESLAATKSNTQASSSVHSSLSDLSISQLSHNNNKPSISSVSPEIRTSTGISSIRSLAQQETEQPDDSVDVDTERRRAPRPPRKRVSKKRETVGRCTPPVTEVLTPGGHKPTPVTSSRTTTITSSRTREFEENCNEPKIELKSILKHNPETDNNEDNNVQAKCNEKHSRRRRRMHRKNLNNVIVLNSTNVDNYPTSNSSVRKKSDYNLGNEVRERIHSSRSILKKQKDKILKDSDSFVDKQKRSCLRILKKSLDCGVDRNSGSDILLQSKSKLVQQTIETKDEMDNTSLESGIVDEENIETTGYYKINYNNEINDEDKIPTIVYHKTKYNNKNNVGNIVYENRNRNNIVAHESVLKRTNSTNNNIGVVRFGHILETAVDDIMDDISLDSYVVTENNENNFEHTTNCKNIRKINTNSDNVEHVFLDFDIRVENNVVNNSNKAKMQPRFIVDNNILEYSDTEIVSYNNGENNNRKVRSRIITNKNLGNNMHKISVDSDTDIVHYSKSGVRHFLKTNNFEEYNNSINSDTSFKQTNENNITKILSNRFDNDDNISTDSDTVDNKNSHKSFMLDESEDTDNTFDCDGEIIENYSNSLKSILKNKFDSISVGSDTNSMSSKGTSLKSILKNKCDNCDTISTDSNNEPVFEKRYNDVDTISRGILKRHSEHKVRFCLGCDSSVARSKSSYVPGRSILKKHFYGDSYTTLKNRNKEKHIKNNIFNDDIPSYKNKKPKFQGSSIPRRVFWFGSPDNIDKKNISDNVDNKVIHSKIPRRKSSHISGDSSDDESEVSKNNGKNKKLRRTNSMKKNSFSSNEISDTESSNSSVGGIKNKVYDKNLKTNKASKNISKNKSTNNCNNLENDKNNDRTEEMKNKIVDNNSKDNKVGRNSSRKNLSNIFENANSRIIDKMKSESEVVDNNYKTNEVTIECTGNFESDINNHNSGDSSNDETVINDIKNHIVERTISTENMCRVLSSRNYFLNSDSNTSVVEIQNKDVDNNLKSNRVSKSILKKTPNNCNSLENDANSGRSAIEMENKIVDNNSKANKDSRETSTKNLCNFKNGDNSISKIVDIMKSTSEVVDNNFENINNDNKCDTKSFVDVKQNRASRFRRNLSKKYFNNSENSSDNNSDKMKSKVVDNNFKTNKGSRNSSSNDNTDNESNTETIVDVKNKVGSRTNPERESNSKGNISRERNSTNKNNENEISTSLKLNRTKSCFNMDADFNAKLKENKESKTLVKQKNNIEGIDNTSTNEISNKHLLRSVRRRMSNNKGITPAENKSVTGESQSRENGVSKVPRIKIYSNRNPPDQQNKEVKAVNNNPRIIRDRVSLGSPESGLNRISYWSAQGLRITNPNVRNVSSLRIPVSARNPVRPRATEIPQLLKKSPPAAPIDRRAASRRPGATLPAKVPSATSAASRDQSRVTGVTPQKGGSPLRTQPLPEKTPAAVQATHLLPHVKHSAKGVEALGVLVQYLVFNLDAFRTPSLKRELENIRTQWIKDKLELEETRMGYRRLEDAVSEQKILAAQTIEEERIKFRAEITELFEKQRRDVAELNERNKQELIELEQRLAEDNNELRNQLDLEISNRENEISIRIEAYVSEHRYKLLELEKENERLRRNNQSAVDILREENEAIREQLDEKTSMIEDLKELKYINNKLKDEFTLKERKFEEKLIAAQDEIALLKEENKKILETFKSDTKDNKLQAALGRCTQLQDEVESLRTVLDLKLAELSELRRAHGELSQAAEELPAALLRAQSLQARVEDLELQLERKTDVELQLTKDNKRLQESLSQESKQNKRLTLHNEELQWKLKQNSEVVNAILQGQTPNRKSLHGSNQSLCDDLSYKTPTGSFMNRTHHTSSFNEKHHGTSHILERTLSFRERTSHFMKDTTPIPNRIPESQSPTPSPNERFHNTFDLDDSPPSSPKVKGVVEKSDSVSWVLDMDESPEVIASRMVRRAGSFRNVTPPKSTPTKSPASKRPRTKVNNLSLSASAGAIVSPDDKNDNRYRSKSVSLRDSHSQSPEICHPGDYLSNSWHYSLRTSTPTKSGLETIRSTVKLENNPDLEHDSDVAISLPALPSEISRKKLKDNCSKPDSLPSLPSGDLLLLQSSFPKNSAGEAMISESNSEDECSSSTSERSPSASDTETSEERTGGSGDKCMPKSKLQYDLFLLTESATNSEAMDCSWSEDLEV